MMKSKLYSNLIIIPVIKYIIKVIKLSIIIFNITKDSIMISIIIINFTELITMIIIITTIIAVITATSTYIPSKTITTTNRINIAGDYPIKYFVN